MRSATLVFTVFLGLFLGVDPCVSLADIVKASKNGKVLIQLDVEGSLAPGDRVFTLDGTGKKKGVVKIEKIKGKQALGIVQKGQVTPQMTIQPARGAPKTSKTSSEDKNEESSRSSSFAAGALLGIGMDSLSVKLAYPNGTAAETIAMKGTGYSFRVLADYNFTSYLGLRVLAGIEQLTATGTAERSLCEGSTQCVVEILYGAFDGWLRYALYDSQTKIWLGAGFGVLFPMSKSSNTLDPASIATTSAFYIGAGSDINLNPTTYLPVQVDYAFLPNSDQVTASLIGIRAGMGIRF